MGRAGSGPTRFRARSFLGPEGSRIETPWHRAWPGAQPDNTYLRYLALCGYIHYGPLVEWSTAANPRGRRCKACEKHARKDSRRSAR